MSEDAKLETQVETQVEMFGGNVLIQRDKPQERKSPGGIVLPAQAAHNRAWATVVAVGPDAQAAVQPRDRVLVGQFSGTEVRLGDEPYAVVRLEDLLGRAVS